MKAKMRDLLSFSETEIKRSDENPEKIELAICPLKEMMCKVHLSSVHKTFLESEKYRREKDFPRTIDTLKNAFNKTTELMGHPCTKCTQLYRSNIIESLESIHEELGKLSKGIFGNKRYKLSYINADNMLREFESAGLSNKFQINDSRERFLGNILN
jgi:transposase-like protein